MLQLIGWLGCLYLVVKALELTASSSFRDENGQMRPHASFGALLAWLGAAAFALLLYQQGAPAPDENPDELGAAITRQCIELAKTPEDAEKCRR